MKRGQISLNRTLESGERDSTARAVADHAELVARATDADDSPHKLAIRIKAKVLVAGADNDPSFPPEQAALLASASKDAGVDHRVEIWQGAAHGWTVRDFAIFNEAAAERHFNELVALCTELD